MSDSIAPALTMVVGTDASMQTHGRASTRVYTQHVRRTRLQEDAHCLWRGCAQPTLVIDRRGASKHTLFLCHRRASHAHPLLNKHAARACARARQRAAREWERFRSMITGGRGAVRITGRCVDPCTHRLLRLSEPVI